ncbi:MAG: SDR family NAD(P)-dependent oxidoreductase [Planctomycetota bacterium]|jgi:NAD(P)-dependent dehydrogenase (short-subunit alcohol dehydrogenase family)
MDLNGKTMIVTGAGSGVGQAIALEFSRHQANVVVVGRRLERLDETVSLIEKENGAAFAVQADITDISQLDNMTTQVLEKFGAIDVIFNNAGSFSAIGSVWEIDPDLWWKDVTINLRGTMLCCRAVLPHMIERNEGIVINMAGGNQIPGGTGYSCSKLGVGRLTELLAKELKHKNSSVMTFTMGPGFVHTEMTDVQIKTPEGQEWLPSSKDAVESGKARAPEDCAKAAVRLIKAACPELCGGTYGPDADFDSEIEKRKEL